MVDVDTNIVPRLERTVRLAMGSKLYRDKFKGRDVKIVSVDDFRRLPFTTKEDLREYYPYGGLAVDMSEVVDLHTSSGTSGKPVGSFLTADDIDAGNEAIGRAWQAFGITASSRVMFAMRYGLFSGAPINTYALQSIGAFVIPAGIVPIDKHIEMIFDYGVDTLVALPGFFEYLYDRLVAEGINIDSLPLKRVIAAGETYSEATRRSIESKLGVTVFDHYGLAEVNTGVLYECANKNGMHVLDDYVHAEVINEDGRSVHAGDSGELVLTSLKKEASPVIRYRTGDRVVSFGRVDCSCGTDSQMVSRIMGRIDSLVSIKGAKIDPYEARAELQKQFPVSMEHGVCSFVIKRNRIDYTPLLLVPSGVTTKEMSDMERFLKEKTMLNFCVETRPLDYWFHNKNKARLVEYA